MPQGKSHSKFYLALGGAGTILAFSSLLVIRSFLGVYAENSAEVASVGSASQPTQKSSAVLGATKIPLNCITQEEYLKKIAQLIPDLVLRHGTEVIHVPTTKILSCQTKIVETIVGAQSCTEYSLSIDNSCIESLLTSTYRFTEPTELIRSAKTGGTIESRIADNLVDYSLLADQVTDLFQKSTNYAVVTNYYAVIKSPIVIAPTSNDRPSTDGRFANRYIEIDGSRQLLFLWEDGNSKRFRISGAFPEYNPVGIHQIFTRSTIAWSRPASKWMPYWQAFTFDPSQNAFLGIHGLVYWYPGLTKTGDKKIYEPISNIGKPKSTGCLRLTVEDAKKVYDWAKVGDFVVVHN